MITLWYIFTVTFDAMWYYVFRSRWMENPFLDIRWWSRRAVFRASSMPRCWRPSNCKPTNRSASTRPPRHLWLVEGLLLPSSHCCVKEGVNIRSYTCKWSSVMCMNVSHGTCDQMIMRNQSIGVNHVTLSWAHQVIGRRESIKRQFRIYG